MAKDTQTLGEGLDRVMRYQLYKSIGIAILAGLMYLAAWSEQQRARKAAGDDGFILIAILVFVLGLVLLGLLISHSHFAIGVWIALTVIGVVVRARRKAAMR